MKTLLGLAEVFLFLFAQAHADVPLPTATSDLCICQTGDAPQNQIKFFKMGCKSWLASQSCNDKETTDIKQTLGSSLQKYANVKKVKIGYVGHWASAAETVSFLKSNVTPDLSKFNLQYVDIDNTACLSNDNPYDIISYFKKIGSAQAAKLNVRGNQVNSSGMWDPVLPGKTNFWAVSNGQNLQAIFPNCAEFSGKKCYANFQKDSTAVCYNSTSKKYERLSCLKKFLGYTWQPQPHLNLEITAYKNKILNRVTFGFADLRAGDMSVLYLSDVAATLKGASATAVLLPQIPLVRLARLTELAKIYGVPLTPVVKSHEQTFMPEVYIVTEQGAEFILQAFETEEEANIFVAKAGLDARVLLWGASTGN